MGIWVELKKDAEGRLRPNWYGAHEANGKRRVVTLNRWKGTPPATMTHRDAGDADFEASRQTALDLARKTFEGDQSAAEKEALARSIYRTRYRQALTLHTLADLPGLWDALPKKRKATPDHAENMKRCLARFVAYMADQWPAVKELGEVTPEQVRAYADALPGIAGAARSCNVHLSVLRAVFHHAAPASVGAAALADLPGMEEDSVHREPFTPEQLGEIFRAAAKDELLRPLVTCAALSAMRKKDVALLRWQSVDLAAGFVTVKTAKTGQTAEIPIFPLLRDELEKALPGKGKPAPTAFVWPTAAALYERNADGLDVRLKNILEAAGFVDPDRAKAAEAALPILPADEVRAAGLAAIARAEGWTTKRRDATRQAFRRYMDGATVGEVAGAMGTSGGGVSMQLNAVENLIGAQVVRRAALSAPVQGVTLAATPDGSTRKKRASLRGWHSFRTTWITLALSAGVPMELVTRVTGSQAVDVVLKNYSRPGRESMRAAFAKALPRQLTEGGAAPKAIDPADVQRLADKLTAKTWRTVKAELAALAG